MDYETAEHRANQVRIQGEVTLCWGTVYRDMADKRIDYAGYESGRMVHFMEVKCRNTWEFYKQSRYGISLAKIRCGLEYAERYKVPFYLVIEFVEGIWYLPVGNRFTVEWGGRTDRGDPKDWEEMAFFDIKDFIPLRKIDYVGE